MNTASRLGAGMVNMPVTVPAEMRDAIRDCAAKSGHSMNQILRRALLEWFQQNAPAYGAKMRSILISRAAGSGFLLILAGFVWWQAITDHQTSPIRKNSSRVQIVRIRGNKRFEFESA